MTTGGQWGRSSAAALILGVTTRTVSRWAEIGRLDGTWQRTLGGHRRYDLDMLRQLADERTDPASDGAA